MVQAMHAPFPPPPSCINKIRWVLCALFLLLDCRGSFAFLFQGQPASFLPPVSHHGLGKRRVARARVSPYPLIARNAATVGSNEAMDAIRLQKDLEIIKKALNEEHKDSLVKFALDLSPLGETARSKNFWYGDSFRVTAATVESLSVGEMQIRASITETGFFGGTKDSEQVHTINFSQVLDRPVTRTSDTKLALIRMLNYVGNERATGPIYALRVDDNRWDIPNNLFLNNVPHSRTARSFFYSTVTRAIDNAINDPTCPRRMRVTVQIPETNASFDTYRIGTILEMCRDAVLEQAMKGKRVKFCVQGRLGEGIFNGLPLSLNGCRLIMENMDWRTGPGEELEGIIGSKVFFGDVGPEVVEDEDEVFLVISPQNMIGVSIIPLLEAMADKAGDRPFIVFNPYLKDRPSSNDIMQVRGREERTNFINSFHDIFAFNCQHQMSVFKIIGAVGKASHNQPWVIYKLQEQEESDSARRSETYTPTRVTDQQPDTILL